MNRLPVAALPAILAGFMIAHAPVASAHEPAPQAAQSASAARSAPQTEVLAVLQGYRASLSALDAPAAARFFWPDSQVFEQGGVEGDFARYLEHHLGPEMLVFSAFEMIDPVVRVVVAGDTAYATETYRFRIAFKDAARAPVERQGVATSVLERRNGEWRILSYHSSSRAPRTAH